MEARSSDRQRPPLVTEAVREAVTREADGLTTRVMTAEHLMAIALQTGRPKDIARLLAFQESGTVDTATFLAILTRHHLLEKWTQFQKKHLDEP